MRTLSKAEQKAVVTRMRQSLRGAEAVVGDLYQSMMSRRAPSDMDEQCDEEALSEALAGHLSVVGAQFAIGLEMLGLVATRQSFLESWAKFQLRDTEEWHNDNGDGVESKPLSVCRDMLRMIEAPYQSAIDADERARLDILEFTLESAAKILQDRGAVPTKEIDVQRILHAHLNATFASFTTQVTISKPMVAFKPDSGIVDLRTALELKFVDSLDEFKTAMHGLNEDLSGYAGSQDWTRFYSLIYQTAAFGTQAQCRQALRLSGNAARWKVFVVTGAGSRSRRK